MKKILLVSVITLAPFAAFAHGFVAAGDVNAASTSVNSSAGVSGSQNTNASTAVKGNGAVMVGTVSGNYSSVQTGGKAKAGPQGSDTKAAAQQTNVGGTVSGGMSTGKNATGQTGGSQGSQASGNAGAAASNTNIGGFAKIHH